MRHSNKLAKIFRARELRQEATKAEKFLWEHIKNRGFCNKKFRRQHVFHGFILDFYCSEEKLAIELDGPVHLKQKDYDAARQEIIEDFNINVLRFKNVEVLKDIKGVLGKIKEKLDGSPHPQSD